MILDEELPADIDYFGPMLRAKTSVITAVLNTQVRVDETAMRRAQFDRLPALLKLVNDVAKSLPVQAMVLPAINAVQG